MHLLHPHARSFMLVSHPPPPHLPLPEPCATLRIRSKAQLSPMADKRSFAVKVHCGCQTNVKTFIQIHSTISIHHSPPLCWSICSIGARGDTWQQKKSMQSSREWMKTAGFQWGVRGGLIIFTTREWNHVTVSTGH